MKTLDEWLSVYAESHQNPTNKMIHNVAVPVIFFTVIVLAWKLSLFLFLLVAAATLGFYYLLGRKVAILGAVLILVCLLLQWVLGFGWLTLIVLFALAWGGQFYGHKVEGKQPSFFEDLQFLLVGPLWVAEPLLKMFNIRA